MKIIIDTKVIQVKNINPNYFLNLLALYITKKSINNSNNKEAILKNHITSEGLDANNQFINIKLTQEGVDFIEEVIVDSEIPDSSKKLMELATELKNIFPKGRKEGTNFYWADGVALIVKRLKIFIKKYGDIYTEEQIIKAAKKYVESFNGDYRYMKLLKYFIFKEETESSTSDLLTYIENAEEESDLKNNWDIVMK
jgi:hypothetical protein